MTLQLSLSFAAFITKNTSNSLQFGSLKGPDDSKFEMPSTLNPSARCYSYTGPTVFMGPAPNICFLFQFSECKHQETHRNEIGELQLHICQPCLQLRNTVVEHSSMSSNGKKYVGAISCPYSVSTSSLTSTNLPENVSQPFIQPVTILPPVQPSAEIICKMCNHSKCTCEKYPHPPSIKCICNACDYFMSNLQDEIDDCPWMTFDLYDVYLNIHEGDPGDQYLTCDECEYEPAAPWSYLCEMCDKYFGGMKGRDLYNEELAKEKEATSGCYQTSDYDYFSSDSDWWFIQYPKLISNLLFY